MKEDNSLKQHFRNSCCTYIVYTEIAAKPFIYSPWIAYNTKANDLMLLDMIKLNAECS